MTSVASVRLLLLFCGVLLIVVSGGRALAQPAGARPPAVWRPVEQAMGVPGTWKTDGVLQFSFPRSDLNVSVRNVRINPALALTTQVNFTGVPANVVMMGELVLRDDEVEPVMRRLESNAVQVTALHEHLLHLTPHINWLHFVAIGDGPQLARAVHNALLASGTRLLRRPSSARSARRLPMPTAQLNNILRYTGKTDDGVYTYEIPRPGQVAMNGRNLPHDMGIEHELHFQSEGGSTVAAAGEFILLPGEVNHVIRALQSANIEVEAVHNHMLAETPRVFFLHYWALGDAARIARGLRAALNLSRVEFAAPAAP